MPAGDVNAAAVAAYRASIREGKPLSERKLAAAFGRTSRRWARKRMAEARQGPTAGLTGRVLTGTRGKGPLPVPRSLSVSVLPTLTPECSPCLLQSEHGWPSSRHG